MATTVDFNNLTKQQLADIVGRNIRTITTWKNNGCPRNRNGKYNAPLVIDWLLSNKEAEREESTADSTALERYRLARAEREEFELKRVKDSWVEREWVEIQLAKRAMIIKADMENFFRSRAQEIVAKCGGKQEFTPDIINYLLVNLEVWLGRYAKPVE